MHKLKSECEQASGRPLRRLLRSMRLDREEGQVLPIFAAGLLAMLAMTGLVIDGGNLFQNRQSLQNAADAAAVAAAQYLTHPETPCALGASVGACAATYANYNGVTATTPLPVCANTVTATVPPTTPPGCYVYPYTPPGASSNNFIEVWLTKNTSNFFGGLIGHGTSRESARAVGTVTSGTPPAITFAALDNSCDNHTLLIKLGGHLQVDSGIYVNSCDDHDGFDLFGSGSISAPNIKVHGGWETHDGSKVCGSSSAPCVPSNYCQFPPNNAPNWKIVWNPPAGTTPNYVPTRPGCPDIGQPEIPDPFLNFPPAPDLGPGNVGVPISIAKVSRGLNGAAANNAKVVTTSPHGLNVNDSVTVSGVGFGFDGTYTVATVPDSTSFTYSNSGTNLPAITQRQVAGGVVTLTTNAPTTLATGGPDTSVTVSGINPFFNLAGLVTAPSSSGSTNSFSYPSAYADPVSKKGLQQGTATLTLGTIQNLVAGNTMTVTGVDPLLNTPANTTVAITPGGGTTVTYADSATTKLSVTNKAIATSTTATLTTSANNHVFAGDQVAVSLGDSRFDGTFTATAGGGAAGGATFKYTIPAVTANITTGAVSGGTFTLTTASGPPIENGDTVGVSTGLLAYDNAAATVSSVNTGSHTFVYTPGTFQNNSWSFNLGNHQATLVMASAHGVGVGDVITVAGFGGAQACMNVTNKPVLAVLTPKQFTYQAPTTCSPGPPGNNKATITLVTAASHAISGTVSLTTASVPVSPTCSNCITAPAFIASGTAATGSVTLWDSALVNSGGTFTPSWMPSSGVTSQNLPGSPGIPSPVLISTGTVTLQPGTFYGGLCIGAAVGSNCVGTTNCKAVGGTTTTTVPYSPAVKVAVAQPGDDTDPNYNKLTVNTAAPITVGDLIAVDDEDETVTAINGVVLTVTREANGTEEADHAVNTPVLQVVTAPNGSAYAPAKKLAAAATAAATSLTVNNTNPNPVGVGDVIQIDVEAMTVIAIPDATHLTVTRGTFNTTPAAHANGKAILKVFDASAPPPPSVTLTKGVYIMAGGGFAICGGANVNAPNGVMIYNTNDPAHPAGNGALGQVNINTAGVVHLHPMTDGIYAGMTIFQDRGLALVPGSACGGRGSDTKSDQWDIALQSAAPLGSNGELASVTGTIYAPHQRADFGDTMSGTSNLAIITSCIYINGADSTFLHNTINPGSFFGASATLGG